MSERLFAYVAAAAEKSVLVELAGEFAYRIEWCGDGVLFETTGTEKLFGKPDRLAGLIEKSMKRRGIEGRVAVSKDAGTAILQARNRRGASVVSDATLDRIPLAALDLPGDTLDIFGALGIADVGDLKKIPEEDLIARYGGEFREIADLLGYGGKVLLTPNTGENKADWAYRLDFPVLGFEQLIFIVRHGLERLFAETEKRGFKTESIAVRLGLEGGGEKEYEIRVSFPTLDARFWMKVISLRIDADPPPAGIVDLRMTVCFTRPRVARRSLYSTTSLQPESLLLTVTKIKNLIGEGNVGVPVVLDQRLREAFALDSDRMPAGVEPAGSRDIRPGMAFSYFRPPLRADVVVNRKRLVYVRTARFAGKVLEYGGVWRESAQWWNEQGWHSEEWDVEIENGGLYRLARQGTDWLVTGEYD